MIEKGKVIGIGGIDGESRKEGNKGPIYLLIPYLTLPNLPSLPVLLSSSTRRIDLPM